MGLHDHDAKAVPALSGPPMPGPLGVGFGCVPMLPDALYTPDLLDFVEITPEIFHRERLLRIESNWCPTAAVRCRPAPLREPSGRGARCGAVDWFGAWNV